MANQQTYEEYEKGRQPLLDRQSAADEDIHKYERKLDEDCKVGDEKASRYDLFAMKDAEGRFNKASEDLAAYDRNYWDKSGKDMVATEGNASTRQTYEEYEKGRQPLLDRQSAADEDIHKYERKLDEDCKVGDEKAARYDWFAMKDAEGRFNKASEDLAAYDKDYWGKSNEGNKAGADNSAESEKTNDVGLEK